MPPRSGFAEALSRVPLVVSLASRPSETASRARIVLPALHWLESWGDYLAREGALGLMQPAMGPIQIDGKPIEGKPVGDILLSLGRQALGSEEGKGPLPWPSFAAMVRGDWEALAPHPRARQGASGVLGGVAPAGGHVVGGGECTGRDQGRRGAGVGRPASTAMGSPCSSIRRPGSTTGEARTTRGSRRRPIR